MWLFIDGSYVYKELAHLARKQQEVIYETKQHIGCIQPINHYVLVFDTLIRILLLWKNLLDEINRRYDVNRMIIIKRPLPSMYRKRYNMTLKRRVNQSEYQQLVQNTIDKYNFCGHRFSLKLREMFDKIATYFHTYTDIQWGRCDQQFKNGLIKEILYLYSVDQTYLQQEEHEYIYSIFCSSFETICSSAKFYNSLYLSNKPKRSNETFDINFHILNVIRRHYHPHAEFETIEISESRTIKQLVKGIYPYVLYFCDENFMPIIKHARETYIENRKSELSDAIILPRSTKPSKYSMFKPLFVEATRILRLNLSKYI